MSEFNYFCTRSEFSELLEDAIKAGYRIRLDIRSTEPTPTFIHSKVEIESVIRHGNVFLLLEHPDVSRYPVGLRKGKKDNEEYWYVRSSVGGPVIDVGYWAPYEKNGIRRIPSVSIAYHSKIENPLNRQLEGAGDAIKKAFTEFVTPIRKASRKVKTATKTAYVSLGVDALLNSGWVLAEPFG